MSIISHDRKEINPMDENLNRIPKILYKYRSFDSCGYGLALASNGEAYFSSAKDFNDPFDNYFIPTSKITDYEGKELIEYLENKARQHYPSANKDEIKELIERGVEQRSKLKAGDPSARERILETQYKKFGIFSLTANPNSIPMWAYYGDSHKGICVGLRSSIIAQHQINLLQQREIFMLHQVDYSDNIPGYCVDIETGGISEKQLHDLEVTLYTKSNYWEHEAEYRLIFHNYVAKNYIFGTDSVAEILIGLRAGSEDIDTLLNQLRLSNSKSIVKQAIQSQSNYALIFKEISY